MSLTGRQIRRTSAQNVPSRASAADAAKRPLTAPIGGSEVGKLARGARADGERGGLFAHASARGKTSPTTTPSGLGGRSSLLAPLPRSGPAARRASQTG